MDALLSDTGFYLIFKLRLMTRVRDNFSATRPAIVPGLEQAWQAEVAQLLASRQIGGR
jgi:hypothetical protein